LTDLNSGCNVSFTVGPGTFEYVAENPYVFTEWEQEKIRIKLETFLTHPDLTVMADILLELFSHDPAVQGGSTLAVQEILLENYRYKYAS
jgi:hypothetical protein